MMRYRIHLVLAALLFCPGTGELSAQSTVNIGIGSAGKLSILYWPASITNFVLQTAATANSTNWVTATNSVSYTACLVTNTGKSAFFRLYIPPANPAGTKLIPGGTSIIGDTLDGEVDAIPVSVSVTNFYMDQTLVTYSLWQSVYAYATTHGYAFANAGQGRDTNHPVQSVDWYDAVKWSNARSKQAGLTAVYYTDAALTQVYATGEVTPYVNWAANGFRLPTEAEWEIAARGGLIGQRFPWGNTINEGLANYYGYPCCLSYDAGPSGDNPAIAYGTYSYYTSPVGYYQTNGFGLLDMAGNVDEWCWDWYGTPYSGGNNPHGPATGTHRVHRGGNWNVGAQTARCGDRAYDLPATASGEIGFRCVRH